MTLSRQRRESTERLLMLMAGFGQVVSTAMEQWSPDGEFTGNLPILVLCRLDLHGPARPAELSTLTHLTSGGLTKLIDRLEVAQLVRRSYGAVPTDHRAVLVSLTPAGRRMIRKYVTVLDREMAAAVGLVDEINRALQGLPRPAGDPG